MLHIQSMDWGAAAAWIALIVSITGTIIGPIITTILTNRHQLKLREIDIKQKESEKYIDARNSAISSFISKTGQCITSADIPVLKELGLVYYNVYAYIPESLWKPIDELYLSIVRYDWEDARKKFVTISHSLAGILKESPQ